MPFSRYQIRNEFSLADPELYKAADKDDPEALLEGVAMAGLVGVLRQLGDLAEFAAEVFHGLHEEVMATAARGHGLLTRVQQVESDFPLIERAFLSQTGHSEFFSSPGISWHPNLQAEQNLITKGDLPRFVMDSYEESRGPPRLFLLDKFDVAGAGACLKRYTDPSIYKVEVSSYEMMTAEAQRDKKIRKTKKKGARWKNGDTPEAFQPSHVKLHQLLLEERVQNGASEPARCVKIKKREIKFPFDTETGKGYMEKLLSSPPEDKLVHEVKLVNPPLRLPTNSSEEPEFETVEDKMVNSPLDDIEEKHISIVEENKEDGNDDVCQSDDVASETDNYMDALATIESEVETDVELRVANSDSIVKEETFFNSNIEKLQEPQISDYESIPIKNQVTTSSYSDSDSTAASPTNMSPRGLNSPHAFASTEIPFRPRVLPTQVTDNLVEASDNVDEETIFEESDSKESGLIGPHSNNCIDVNVPTKGEDAETNPQNEDDNSSSTLVSSHVEEQSFDPARGKVGISEDVLGSRYDLAEAGVSDSNEDGPELKDEVVSVDSESQNADAAVHDNFDSNEIKDLSSTGEPGENGSVIHELGSVHDSDELVEKESVVHELGSVHDSDELVEKESVVHELGSVHDSDELVEKESFEESVVSPEPDSIPSTESTESDEKKDVSEESVIPPEQNSLSLACIDDSHNQFLDNICDGNENDVENPDLELLESGEMKESSVESVIPAESDSILSAYNDRSNIQFLDNGHETGYENDVDNLEKESVEFNEQKESRESDSIPSAYSDHPDIQFLDGIHKNGNDDANNAEKEPSESGEKKESSEEPVISLESDSIPSAYNAHLIHYGNEHDVDNVEKELNESGEEESSEEPVIYRDSDSVPSAYHDHPNIQFLDNVHNNGDENDVDNPSTELIESGEKKESAEESDSIPSVSYGHSNVQDETVFITEKTVQNGLQDVPQDAEIPSNTQFVDCGPYFAESEQTQESKPSSVDQDGQLDKLDQVVDLSKLLPELAPVNMEEMPPLPPLPPVQWRMGRFQNPSSISISGGSQADTSNFPPVFPQIETHPSLNQNEIARTEKSERDQEVKFAEEIKIAPQPPVNTEESKTDSISEPEIIRLSSTSSLPEGDNEMPNGIRPMKIQRPRTPLIDAVAAHDKNKLRKVAERAVPLFPKEEEKDTFLEQIRAKSFSLKPAVPSRPIIQGPTTNLRVAAILEKANAIRQAFAGSDDDEDDNDSWSDS